MDRRYRCGDGGNFEGSSSTRGVVFCDGGENWWVELFRLGVVLPAEYTKITTILGEDYAEWKPQNLAE